MWQTSTGALPGQTEGIRTTLPTGGRGGPVIPPPASPHTASSDADNYKSIYDSHSDSGFLSGSNLVYGSSSEDQHHSTSTSGYPSSAAPSAHTMPKRDLNPYTSSEESKNLTSSGCLDSGIDISEQMISLKVSEEDISSVPSYQKEESAPSVAPSAAPNNELSLSHVVILREIFTRDNDGDTQLHIAVMRGFIEIILHVSRLLPHQALLDYPNNGGRTALHLAVSAGVPSIARHLVVCGASPVARDAKGNTPLHVACGRKDAEMVTHLTRPVTHSEVINARLMYSPTHTPGLLAADLNNYQGETCVHVAARAEEKEILHHLTRYGADINAKEFRSGRTALHYAVESRDPELVAYIVNVCRASVTVETYARLSPYQLALANCATGIATQLLDLGAPAQILPAAFAPETDSDEEEDYEEYNQAAILSSMNGFSNGFTNGFSSMNVNGLQEVDDIRLAGIPVTSQSFNPVPPVSTAPHTINADLFY